jgi:hypothetical protein
MGLAKIQLCACQEYKVLSHFKTLVSCTNANTTTATATTATTTTTLPSEVMPLFLLR